MPTFATDLDYTIPQAVEVPEFQYPFEHLGDLATVVISRTFKQYPANFKADKAAGLYLPGAVTDSEVADAWLLGTSKPTTTPNGLYKFTRTYARIPADQITYTSQPITRPNASSLGLSAGTLSTNLGSALGALTSYLGYFWGNNEVFGPRVTSGVSSATSGSDTRVTKTSHGLTGSSTILAGGATYRRYTSAQYSVIDSDNFDLLGVNLGSGVVEFDVKLRDYTPGSDRVGVRLTQKFYLPGVTSGITTGADIPIPTPLLNDADFLASVIAHLTGYQTYDATELIRWMDSPSYTQTLREINMADF